ncbi:MAG: NfeD family protein [Kiritimatiellae bacterium]|nr:NfeD family protein [Kiritimatiellia bacterium]
MMLFLTLLFCGFLLLAVEIFVPGGVLGTLGAVALFGAVISAFAVFGPQTGFLVAILMLILMAVGLVLWIRIFPNTPIGRALTLSKDGQSFKLDSEASPPLVGAEGSAQTDLRPAGIAVINGRRMDVVAEGEWIAAGTPVRVISAKGNHVTVRRKGEPG